MRLPPEKDIEPQTILLTKRAAAYATDIALLMLVLFPINFLVQSASHNSASSGLENWMGALLGFSLPMWIYCIVSDSSSNGATLGKRWWGIQVVDLQSQRLSLERAFVRTAWKLTPWELAHLTFLFTADAADAGPQRSLLAAANFLGLAYFAIAIFTQGQRSTHDYLAGTRVQLSAR